MNEKEYIKVKALGTITAAINTLKDLVPECLEDVITKAEYNDVMPTLYDWQERLFEQIKMDDRAFYDADKINTMDDEVGKTQVTIK